MSSQGRCPECEVGDLFIEEVLPDWPGADISYVLKCNHCSYEEDADWFDPADEE